MKIFEKHKKYKKYTLFNPSNYSSSEFYDMSTSNSKRFSFISDFQDEDSFYRPFLKKDCFRSLIDFGIVLNNNKDNLAQCLGLKFDNKTPKPKLVIIKSWEEYKKNRTKKRKKRNLPIQRSCRRSRVHAEGRAIDLQISWVTDEKVWRKIIEKNIKNELFSQLENYAKGRFDFVKIINLDDGMKGSKKPLLHVSCDDTD
ncbi:unnamed protein product [Oikopleura dioica]|uniref:Uncharacterized protein n=2 Tax=Oikopleura dioica TaxID=34765 RepID=E4X3Y2_OIKDI|nr:unnamed protein product [Oikopleura dioica]